MHSFVLSLSLFLSLFGLPLCSLCRCCCCFLFCSLWLFGSSTDFFSQRLVSGGLLNSMSSAPFVVLLLLLLLLLQHTHTHTRTLMCIFISTFRYFVSFSYCVPRKETTTKRTINTSASASVSASA